MLHCYIVVFNYCIHTQTFHGALASANPALLRAVPWPAARQSKYWPAQIAP